VSLVAFALMACFGQAHAADKREDQFKAGYLLNFMKFVEWPAFIPADSLTICFVGGSGIYDSLAADIDTKRVGERRLVARKLGDGTKIETCNALYVDAAANVDLATLVSSSQFPILTVSDSKSFATKGGMIELFTEKNRLRFRINADTAQGAGLRVSSNLLQLGAPLK
jgi:YfiR/HmsC-like